MVTEDQEQLEDLEVLVAEAVVFLITLMQVELEIPHLQVLHKVTTAVLVTPIMQHGQQEVEAAVPEQLVVKRHLQVVQVELEEMGTVNTGGGGGGGSDGGTTTTGGAGGSGVGFARYVYTAPSPDLKYSIGGATGGPVS